LNQKRDAPDLRVVKRHADFVRDRADGLAHHGPKMSKAAGSAMRNTGLPVYLSQFNDHLSPALGIAFAP
jgi:hypothetical protein